MDRPDIGDHFARLSEEIDRLRGHVLELEQTNRDLHVVHDHLARRNVELSERNDRQAARINAMQEKVDRLNDQLLRSQGVDRVSDLMRGDAKSGIPSGYSGAAAEPNLEELRILEIKRWKDEVRELRHECAKIDPTVEQVRHLRDHKSFVIGWRRGAELRMEKVEQNIQRLFDRVVDLEKGSL